MVTYTTRNASLADLAEMLTDQQARKLDLVVPATEITADGGLLVVTGSEPIITEHGVTLTDGAYVPTVVADEGVADKLGIPVAYLKRLRAERPDLYDANVNGWLHGDDHEVGPDGRKFLLRTFKSDETGKGIARALLSDKYMRLDNLDALTSALEGVRASGVHVEIAGADLTDRRMTVRLIAPEIQALAPVLLRGYRSPFSGASGDENPVVFAGLVISNSETGGGAFTITPRLVVQVCSNGMTITKDALRAVHLGGRLDEGVVNWSEETQAKAIDLVKSKTADAVKTFLDVDYMTRVITRAEAEAGKPVDTVDQVREVTKSLSLGKDHIDGVLGHFIKGGQMTLGGVSNAITSYAQEVDNGDTAHDLEAAAMALLRV